MEVVFEACPSLSSSKCSWNAFDELRPGCSKSHEEFSHFSCTAINEGTDVDFDTLYHDELSLRKWEHGLVEVVVMESKAVFPIRIGRASS